MMRIEILYVPGCPHYQPAVERVRAALESESLQAEIHSIPINTEGQAKAMLFPGSPTIRINGEDVEPTLTTVPSLSCRLYANRSGVPSDKLLRIAISNAKQRE